MGSMRGRIAASALALSALACSALPAAADWQYTQWGMTPGQVRAASNDVAQPNPDRKLDADGLKADLTAPYQGAAIPFTAVFLFDAPGKLQVVTLNPVGGIACPVIVQALAANHGPPRARPTWCRPGRCAGTTPTTTIWSSTSTSDRATARSSIPSCR